MKKLLVSTLLLASFLTTAQAQEKSENTVYNVYLAEAQYTHAEEKTDKSVAGQVTAILNAAASKTSTTEMSGYVPAVGTAVKRAVANFARLALKEGGAPQSPAEGDILITTEVTSLGVSSSYKSNGVKEDGFVKATITLKDLATGDIIGTRSFSEEKEVGIYATTKEKALTNAIDNLQSDVRKYLWELFPVSGTVLEASETKKDKVKSVYIDLGSADGVYKGQYFKVMKAGNVGGHEIKKEIGRLKIESVQGDEVSECKVVKGDDAIKEAFDDGSKMTVQSILHQGFWSK